MEFDKNKVKLKIAISKIKEENDIVMEDKKRNIFKTVATATIGILLSTGFVFAGSKVIEKIWKKPEKIQNITYEVTEESKKENITEEKAKEIAINKLNEVGFNANIVGTDHYKEVDSNKIEYRFKTEDGYGIEIDGFSGKFCSFYNDKNNLQDLNIEITEEEAIEAANKYYKLFGLKEGDYELTDIQINAYSDKMKATEKGPGCTFQIAYQKKYGEIYNPYEYVVIVVQSKNKALESIRISEIPFDNNETIITEDEAIQIALNEDKKIESGKVVNTKAKKMIVKMNADAYDRINNKTKHYEAMQTVDYPAEERNYYNVEDKVRNAWVVVLTYEDNFGDDVVKRYTEGQYSYFVDCTTGEIIGGATMDYIYSNR